MSQRAFVVALAAAAGIWAGRARATEAGLPPVELAVAGDTALAERLRAELGAAGFAVTSSPADEITAPCEPGEQGRPTRAVVVVRTNPSGGEATPEVCVLAQATGEVMLREVVVPDPASPNADGVLAVRVVELLRAGLLAREPTPAPPPRAVARAAAPAVVASAATSPPAARLDGLLLVAAGFGASTSAGATGLGPTIALESWRQWHRLGLGLGVSGPAGATHLAAARESADVYPFAAGAGARARLLGREERLSLFAGAGASLLWFHLRGRDAAAGHVNTTANHLLGAPHGELRLVWAIASRVSLYAAARASFAFPEPVVLFGGRDVARLGRPLVTLTFGAEWRAAAAGPRD